MCRLIFTHRLVFTDKQIRSKRRAPYQIGMNFGIRPPYSSRPKKRGFEIGFSTGYKRPYYPDGSYSPYTTTTTTTMKPVKKRYYVPVFWIPEKKTTTTTTQAPTTRKPKRKAYDFYYPWNWWFYAHHNRYREEPETGGDEESYSSSYSERPQNYYTYKQRPKTITWKPLFQVNTVLSYSMPPLLQPPPDHRKENHRHHAKTLHWRTRLLHPLHRKAHLRIHHSLIQTPVPNSNHHPGPCHHHQPARRHNPHHLLHRRQQTQISTLL